MAPGNTPNATILGTISHLLVYRMPLSSQQVENGDGVLIQPLALAWWLLAWLQEKAKGKRLQAEATLATARSAAATELQQREAQLHAESAALTRKLQQQQQPGSSLGALLLAGEVHGGGGTLPLPPMMGSPAGSAADFSYASVGAAEVEGGEGGRMSGGENVAAGMGLGVELEEMRAAAEALKAKVSGVCAGRTRQAQSGTPLESHFL